MGRKEIYEDLNFPPHEEYHSIKDKLFEGKLLSEDEVIKYIKKKRRMSCG